MNIADGEIKFLGHSGFLITLNRKNIVIDPYRISDNVPKADIVLITHSHNDHCSIRDINKVVKKGTLVFCPVDCQSTLMKVKNVEIHIVEKDDIIDFRDFKMECIPAYTFNKHHPQGEEWLGYLIKSGNNIFYFSGDTDLTPELKNVSGYGKKENNFIVVLPISGNVVMNYLTAADAASLLNPTLAIPHGYGSGVYGTLEDAKKFLELCNQRGINAKILDKV